MEKRMVGVLDEWNHARGYGFITNDRRDVRLYLHVTELVGGMIPPLPGDRITFLLDTDEQGRSEAVKAINQRRVDRLSLSQVAILFLLLGLPVTALIYGVPPVVNLTLAYLTIIFSTISYLLYSNDKEFAEAGRWRVSELKLHLFELIGGWPGAFVAQRRLRHKVTKTAYQNTYWFIVLMHQIVAVDLLHSGEVSYTTWSVLRSVLFAVS